MQIIHHITIWITIWSPPFRAPSTKGQLKTIHKKNRKGNFGY